MKNNTIRLGLVGVGNMGSSHARKIVNGEVPGMELTAVVDLKPERLKLFPDAIPFTDASECYASGKVDAVLIATPHYSHTTLGMAALEAGLHVLVEKPISVHKADCERLINAYRPESKLVFAAMFNQRTDPRYQKLRALIQDGTLGELRRINWVITDWFRTDRYYASGDWRATWAGEGGGVLLNQCPHQLDLWQWMFGMPEKVTAFCQIGRFHDIEVEDSVTAVLEYPGGLQGVFVTTTGEAPGDNRLEVVGDNGTVLIEKSGPLRFRRNEVSAAKFCRETQATFARPPVWDCTIPAAGKGEKHLGILKNFAEAIRDGVPLLAEAVEGIHSVELGNSMLLSTIKGATIALPMDAREFEKELKKKIAESKHEKKTVESGPAEDFANSF